MAAGHGHHPNSLANLRPPWKSGQAGNPYGRKPGVVWVSEHVSSLLAENADGSPRYTKADLEQIVGDEKESPARIIAARWVLTCMLDGRRWVVDRDGKLKPAALDPEPGRAIERLTDRLEGKPEVRVTQTHHRAEVVDLGAVYRELFQLLDEHPALADVVKSQVALPAPATELIDGEVVEALPAAACEPADT